MHLVACLRDMLLVRRGLVLDEATADERARNIMSQLPELLAATRCTGCGAQGTVDGDLCGRCYLAPQPRSAPSTFAVGCKAMADLCAPAPEGGWPPPRHLTDADIDRIAHESAQARREFEELTAPMVAPEPGRVK